MARMAEHEPDPTQLSQQQVGMALLRAIARENPSVLGQYDQLLYHRSTTGAEIDFVGSPLGEIAVESKYVDRKWGRELATIRASRWRAVVATRAGIALDDDALVIPAPMLAVMLGA